MQDNNGSAVYAGGAEKPTKERWLLVAILMLTLLIAYLDRVNVSVLLADNIFLTDMELKGSQFKWGLLMTLFLIAYGISNVLSESYRRYFRTSGKL